jgi:enamine deaminase RidA (YjgF/YER057c/UK114 family)
MNRIVVFLFLLPLLARGESVRSVGKDPISGLAQAVVAQPAPLIHTAQLLPLDRDGKLVGPGNAGKQAAQILKNILEALKSVAPEARVLKLNVYLANESVLPHIESALRHPFPRKEMPAVSFVVTPLAMPDALVAMDAVATDVNAKGVGSTVKLLLSPYLSGSPQFAQMSILPTGGAVYISGQAKTNTTLATSTRTTLASLQATLDFLRLNRSDVVQVKCFLNPMAQLESVKNEIANFFAPDTAPPCVFVEWTAKNPQPIEIELIARSDSAQTDLDFINPPDLVSSKVFTRVVRVNRGGRIYCSSLYGEDKSNSAADQVNSIFNQLGAVLKIAGSDFDHLVKATYYVSTPDASNQLNVLRPKYLNPDRPPAASKAMVQALGVPGKTVAVDMIAVPAQ